MKFIKTCTGHYVNTDYIIAIETEINQEKYDIESGEFIEEDNPHALIWIRTQPHRYLYKRIEVGAEEIRAVIEERIYNEIMKWGIK